MSISKRSAKRCAILGAVAGIASLSAPGAQAAQIGVDFFGGGGSAASSVMAASESAGVIPQTNWNSFSGNIQATPQALVDSAGAATGATVVWNSNNTWNAPNVPPVAPGDLKMMKGYLDAGNFGTATDTTTVTVANLPASITSAPYSVIVYYDGDNGTANRVGKYSITGGVPLYALDAAGSTFSGTYTPGFSPVDPLIGGGSAFNNGVAALTVPAGNFLFFTGLTGSGFTLSAQSYVTSDGTSRAAVQGIQIVSGTVPEPTGLTLLGLGATAILGRRRRR